MTDELFRADGYLREYAALIERAGEAGIVLDRTVFYPLGGGQAGDSAGRRPRLIADEAPPGPEWLDHPLKGAWADCRECHIGGDFVLVYQLFDAGRRIHFVRAGTHAELFER